MDTVISSSSASLPAVSVRTVAASISASASLPLPPHCHWSAPRQRLYYSGRRRSRRRRFWNSSSSSSAVPQFTVTCGAGITEINESQFKDTVLKANRPVLVEFVANWCGPCRLIAPAMESLAQVSSLPLICHFCCVSLLVGNISNCFMIVESICLNANRMVNGGSLEEVIYL